VRVSIYLDLTAIHCSLIVDDLLEKVAGAKPNMYAIFESGGKQYSVSPGDTLDIEKLAIPVGKEVELTDVLMVVDGESVKVGSPTIENAVIIGHVLEHVKGEKLHIFKSKKRKGYRRKIGHRQKYIRLQIDEIKPGAEAGIEE
jgi:large subunit ribosomal protein L21